MKKSNMADFNNENTLLFICFGLSSKEMTTIKSMFAKQCGLPAPIINKKKSASTRSAQTKPIPLSSARTGREKNAQAIAISHNQRIASKTNKENSAPLSRSTQSNKTESTNASKSNSIARNGLNSLTQKNTIALTATQIQRTAPEIFEKNVNSSSSSMEIIDNGSSTSDSLSRDHLRNIDEQQGDCFEIQYETS